MVGKTISPASAIPPCHEGRLSRDPVIRATDGVACVSLQTLSSVCFRYFWSNCGFFGYVSSTAKLFVQSYDSLLFLCAPFNTLQSYVASINLLVFAKFKYQQRNYYIYWKYHIRYGYCGYYILRYYYHNIMGIGHVMFSVLKENNVWKKPVLPFQRLPNLGAFNMYPHWLKEPIGRKMTMWNEANVKLMHEITPIFYIVSSLTLRDSKRLLVRRCLGVRFPLGPTDCVFERWERGERERVDSHTNDSSHSWASPATRPLIGCSSPPLYGALSSVPDLESLWGAQWTVTNIYELSTIERLESLRDLYHLEMGELSFIFSRCSEIL